MPNLSSPTSNENQLVRLERLRNLSQLLDNAIAVPGTKFRFGLDPLLGLIPGGGDMVGLVFSCSVLFEASRLGVSPKTLGQMTFNILLETLVGTVPGIGDLFDVAWKSNTKNIKLLDDYLGIQQSSPVVGHRNRGLTILLIVGVGLAVAGSIALSFFVLRWLYQLFSVR